MVAIIQGPVLWRSKGNPQELQRLRDFFLQNQCRMQVLRTVKVPMYFFRPPSKFGMLEFWREPYNLSGTSDCLVHSYFPEAATQRDQQKLAAFKQPSMGVASRYQPTKLRVTPIVGAAMTANITNLIRSIVVVQGTSNRP